MDFAASSISAQSAPTFVADTRPSADVAASKNVREPAMAFAPTGMVPNTSQAASVSRSMLMAKGVEEPTKAGSSFENRAIERTLKPYGTPMLPKEAEPAGGEKKSAEVKGTEAKGTEAKGTEAKEAAGADAEIIGAPAEKDAIDDVEA